MKKQYISIAAVAVVAAAAAVGGYSLSQTDTGAPAAAPTAAPTTPVTAEQAKTAFSYFVGYKTGKEISQGVNTLSIADFDREALLKGIEEGLGNGEPSMSEDEIRAGLQAFIETLQQREKALAQQNIEKGKAFAAEFAKQEGVTKTDSGLLYRVITKGDGRTYSEAEDGPNAGATVTYEGKLIDGTVFDKSEEPIPMPINRVVPGFSEVLKLMPIGSEWEVCIPSDLAYGDEPSGPIPGGSTLVFTIKLDNISKAAEAPQGGAGLPPEILEQLRAQGLDVNAPDAAPDAAPAPEAAPTEAPAEAPAPAAAPAEAPTPEPAPTEA